MQHLSGRILKPSMDNCFETEYISLLVVIPASRSQLQDSEKDTKTPHTFGRILNESFRQLDLFGASSKTSQDTLQLDILQFIEAYDLWVTLLRQDCLRRQSVMHHIDGNGCLSWLSPKQPSGGGCLRNTPGGGLRKLEDQTEVNWATPEAQNQEGYQVVNSKKIPRLGKQVGQPDQNNLNTNGKSRELFPTPRTETMEAPTSKGYGDTLLEGVMGKKGYQKKRRLNPDWVEQLMGLQVGWTDLGSWVMVSFPNVQKKHLEL
jgi:hypothetical protein